MKCTGCGAPLNVGTEVCPYCGMVTPYGESLVEEKAEQRRDAERRKRLENLPKMKYVSGAFIPVLYFCTFMFYSPYWYATRMAGLNSLGTSKKLPAWGVALFALSWFGVVMLPNSVEELVGGGQNIFNTLLGVSIFLSGWLAFIVRGILQEYAAKMLDQTMALHAVASSNMMSLLFGPMYLQYQVNGMIAMELLAPQI